MAHIDRVPDRAIEQIFSSDPDVPCPGKPGHSYRFRVRISLRCLAATLPPCAAPEADFFETATGSAHTVIDRIGDFVRRFDSGLHQEGDGAGTSIGSQSRSTCIGADPVENQSSQYSERIGTPGVVSRSFLQRGDCTGHSRPGRVWQDGKK